MKGRREWYLLGAIHEAMKRREEGGDLAGECVLGVGAEFARRDVQLGGLSIPRDGGNIVQPREGGDLPHVGQLAHPLICTEKTVNLLDSAPDVNSLAPVFIVIAL